MTINPALADLQPLVGRWRMELYNAPFLPDRDARVSGSIEIDWIEDGSALRMRQGDSGHPQAAGANWEHDFNVDYLLERSDRPEQ